MNKFAIGVYCTMVPEKIKIKKKKINKDELITRLRIYEKCTKFSMKEIVNIDALIEYL